MTDNRWQFTPVPPSLFDYDALAVYNAERSRGIVHTPEWVARMAEIQDCFNAEQLRRHQREVEDAALTRRERRRKNRTWFV